MIYVNGDSWVSWRSVHRFLRLLTDCDCASDATYALCSSVFPWVGSYHVYSASTDCPSLFCGPYSATYTFSSSGRPSPSPHPHPRPPHPTSPNPSASSSDLPSVHPIYPNSLPRHHHRHAFDAPFSWRMKMKKPQLPPPKMTTTTTNASYPTSSWPAQPLQPERASPSAPAPHARALFPAQRRPVHVILSCCDHPCSV